MAEDTSTAAAPATETAAPSAESQHDVKLREFSHAMDAAGLKSRVPASMKYLGKGDTPAPAGDASTGSDSPGKTPGAKPGTEKPKSPYEPPNDLSQRKLAEGFAKLVRKEKELRRSEEERAQWLRDRDAWTTRKESELSELQKQRESWLAEQKGKLDELSVMDSEPDKWLEVYAKRRGLSTPELYDRLLSAKLNDGRLTADHVAADVKAELGRVQNELETFKKQQDEEKKATEKKAAEETERRRVSEIVQRENLAFIKHVCDEEPASYPLLMEEAKADPEGAARKAQELAIFRARERGKPVTVQEVAKEIEDQLRYLDWKEKQAAGAQAQPAAKTPASAKAKADKSKPLPPKVTASPTEGAPADAGAKPEMREKSNGLRSASGPRTLTNRVAARQSNRATLAPRNDNERLKLALQEWQKGV